MKAEIIIEQYWNILSTGDNTFHEAKSFKTRGYYMAINCAIKATEDSIILLKNNIISKVVTSAQVIDEQTELLKNLKSLVLINI